MNTLDSDYDDVLRRALHAAAESVNPSADGLERIRARLSTPAPLSLASLTTWYADVAMRISTWAQPAIGAAASAFWSAIDRFRPEGAQPGHSRPRFGWLRPVAAMGTAIFVVAAGAFAVMTLPQAISSSGSFLQQMPWSQSSGSTGNPGTSTLQGGGTEMPTGQGTPGVPGMQPGTSPASSKCAAVGGSPSGSKSPKPSKAPTTSPPPASSPPPSTPPPATTPTPTPDPTPSDSSTPDPGSTGTPTPSTTDTTVNNAATSAATGVAILEKVKIAAAVGPSTRVPIMLPSKSSPIKPPCPSSTPKKKKTNGPQALGPGGIGRLGVTEHGISGTALAPGESAS
jgi:hypothetical protein